MKKWKIFKKFQSYFLIGLLVLPPPIFAENPCHFLLQPNDKSVSKYLEVRHKIITQLRTQEIDPEIFFAQLPLFKSEDIHKRIALDLPILMAVIDAVIISLMDNGNLVTFVGRGHELSERVQNKIVLWINKWENVYPLNEGFIQKQVKTLFKLMNKSPLRLKLHGFYQNPSFSPQVQQQFVIFSIITILRDIALANGKLQNKTHHIGSGIINTIGLGKYLLFLLVIMHGHWPLSLPLVELKWPKAFVYLALTGTLQKAPKHIFYNYFVKWYRTALLLVVAILLLNSPDEIANLPSEIQRVYQGLELKFASMNGIKSPGLVENSAADETKADEPNLEIEIPF